MPTIYVIYGKKWYFVIFCIKYYIFYIKSTRFTVLNEDTTFFYCFMCKCETTLKNIPFSFYLSNSQTVWTLDAMGVRPGGSPRQKILQDSLAAKELQTMEKHLAGMYGSKGS